MIDRKDCLGVGLLTLDYLFYLEKFPNPDEKLDLNNWKKQLGGPVPVALTVMHQLGRDVNWKGRLGADAAGRWIKKYWTGIKFSDKDIEIEEGLDTPQAYIWVCRDQVSRNVFLTGDSRQSLPKIEAEREWAVLLSNYKWLYLDGRDIEFMKRVIPLAKQAGCKIFMDLGSVRRDWQNIISGCDFVIVSGAFGRNACAGQTPEQVVRFMHDLGVARVGMTIGAEGSVFFDGNKFESISAPKFSAVDTTGAGDVFHGAFLSAWIETQDIRHSAEFATRVAAWSCMREGHSLERLPKQMFEEATYHVTD